jgi:hypothetical protein
MGVLHPIRRIVSLIRGNLAALRQIDSPLSSSLACHPRVGQTNQMTQTDPTLAQIAAQFTKFDVEASRGGYTLLDRHTANPVARLRPIPNTDRFELLYWSNVKDRWTTFGNMRRMKLMLVSAHEIVENDPMFRVPRSRGHR